MSFTPQVELRPPGPRGLVAVHRDPVSPASSRSLASLACPMSSQSRGACCCFLGPGRCRRRLGRGSCWKQRGQSVALRQSGRRQGPWPGRASPRGDGPRSGPIHAWPGRGSHAPARDSEGAVTWRGHRVAPGSALGTAGRFRTRGSARGSGHTAVGEEALGRGHHAVACGGHAGPGVLVTRRAVAGKGAAGDTLGHFHTGTHPHAATEPGRSGLRVRFTSLSLFFNLVNKISPRCCPTTKRPAWSQSSGN